MNFTTKQIASMILDAESVAKHHGNEWMLPDDVACHVKALAAEVERLEAANSRLRSIASNGWLEAWHCGNQFMAMPPDDDQLTVMRCWQESQTHRELAANA